MGCNTSKETIATSEEKEHINGEENCINEVEKTDAKESIEERTHSAKTITINKSKSRPTSGVNKAEQETNVIAVNGAVDPAQELEEAATKIQAAFRGHKSRKSMKQADKPNTSGPTAEDMAKEFRPDDTELCNAATKIQASFRGHVARKQMAKEEHDPRDNKTGDVPTEELDVDLTDPDLNKAAVKIQASFRGHLTRKGNDETK